MKNDKKYLIHKQQKSDSQLTPVDDAWNKMAALLDSEMPVAKPQDKKRLFSVSFSQLAISIVAAMVFVGGGTFIAIKTIENKKENYSTTQSNNYSQHDSLDNKTLQFTDSAIENNPDVQSNIDMTLKSNKEEVLNQKQNNNKTSFPSKTTNTTAQPDVVSVKKDRLNNIPTVETALKTNNSNNATNNISKVDETNFKDSIYSKNKQSDNLIAESIISYKELGTAKIDTKDSLDLTNNSTKEKLDTKETQKKKRIENNNTLFVGLSGHNSFLFSKNLSKNIFSYGELLTIGLRNTKYNIAIETGIGFQSIEYHVPYSRILYTYQATGIYDSTVTVSSYKYSRYSITVPIYVTKEVLHYNNIFLDIKTGIQTSIFVSSQRLFNQLPVDIQLVEDLYPTTSLNFAFALSPQFRWEINNRFSFNLNAGGVFYLNNLFKNHSLKPLGVSLSTGLCYSF